MNMRFLGLVALCFCLVSAEQPNKQVQLTAQSKEGYALKDGEEYAVKFALHHKLGVIKANYTHQFKECSKFMVDASTCGDKEEGDCQHYGIYRWDEGPVGEERSIYMGCEWHMNNCRQKIAANMFDEKAYCWTANYQSISGTVSPTVTASISMSGTASPTAEASASRHLSDAEFCRSLAMKGGVNHRPTMFLHQKLESLEVTVGEKFSSDLNQYFCDPEGDKIRFVSNNLPFNFQMKEASIITGLATKPFHQSIAISVDDGQLHSGWSGADGETYNIWISATPAATSE